MESMACKRYLLKCSDDLLANIKTLTTYLVKGIGLPRLILYRETTCGLPSEVLGAPPGSRQVLLGTATAADIGSGSSSRQRVRRMNVSQRLKPAISGVVIGAAAMTAVGFSSLGWKLG
jgi:hypothetical protein